METPVIQFGSNRYVNTTLLSIFITEGSAECQLEVSVKMHLYSLSSSGIPEIHPQIRPLWAKDRCFRA